MFALFSIISFSLLIIEFSFAAPGDQIVGISGGRQAQQGEFPFLVEIHVQHTANKDDVSACGGSILSADYVITAAHCLKKDGVMQSAFLITVYAGAYDVSKLTTDRNVQTRYVSDWHTNGKYTGNGGQGYDLLVLKLNQPLVLKQVVNRVIYVDSICIPKGSISYVGHTVTTAGWGDTQSGLPRILQTVDVRVQPYGTCKIDSKYVDALICTSDPTGGNKSTCQGDSGGPLLVKENGKWKLIGTLSGGGAKDGNAKCGNRGVYDIWAHLQDPEIREWIEKYVGNSVTC